MKLIFKNILFVLKRFKTSSMLNILGLSVAFAVFILTMILVHYDFSYDRHFEKANSIYYFTRFQHADGIRLPTINMPLAEAMAGKIPEIKNYCLLRISGQTAFDIRDKDGNVTVFEHDLTQVSPGFPDVFTLRITAGNAAEALDSDGKALIPESLAEKMFKDDPIGQAISDRHSQKTYIVAAVYKDFPKNSSIKNDIYTYMPEEAPNNWSFRGYFDLSPSDYDAVIAKLNNKAFLEETAPGLLAGGFQVDSELTPLTRVHLHLKGIGGGNIDTTLSLLAVGILILLIAFINFTNFAIAMAPSRVRNINIHKVLGVGKNRLRTAIASEGVFFSAAAFLLALVYLHFFKGSSLTSIFPADLTLTGNWLIIGIIGAGMLLLSFAIGIYPATYVTSFSEATALKGSFALSPKGVRLRNVLITLQFTAAIALIIIASFIKIQHDYMQHYSWGMERENIVYLPAAGLKTDVKTFGEELKKDPRITDYTSSLHLPGHMGNSWSFEFEDRYISYIAAWLVAPNFLDFFGIKVIAGEESLKANQSRKKMILNREFLKTYGFDESIAGKEFPTYEGAIIAIAEDVNFESLHEPLRPMGFYITNNEEYINFIYLKITGGNTPETINRIRDTWAAFSDDDFNLNFLDRTLDDLYKRESNMARLIGLFGLITVIIAMMGIYGLITFNIRYKVKEIGIRKVNGANEKEIVWMLNRELLIQLGIAFIIACLLAYYVIIQWLNGFAYKSPVYWWIFPLAALSVLLVSAVTVGWQSWKAATMNPVDALKNE